GSRTPRSRCPSFGGSSPKGSACADAGPGGWAGTTWPRPRAWLALGCDPTDVAPPGVAIERWDDVPAVCDDFGAARDAIVAHLRRLLSDLSDMEGGVMKEGRMRGFTAGPRWRAALVTSGLTGVGMLGLFGWLTDAAELTLPANAPVE